MVILLKKTFRDFKRNGTQFLAVFLMSFICLFIFSGINQMANQMADSFTDFEEKSQLADITLAGNKFTEEQQTTLENLSSIKHIQKRAVASIANQDQMIQVMSFKENKISKPVVISGASLTKRKGIWLDDDFMKANNLNVGDVYQINEQKLTILGSIKQPEFVYYTTSKDQPVPNPVKNGYAYLYESYFYDSIPIYNEQLLITTTNTTNNIWLEEEVKKELKDNFYGLTEKNASPGIKIFNERVIQIKRLAILFSGLFLLLTIISVESAMVNFVKQQQLIIGSLKAMGLFKRTILLHYTTFALILTATGSFLGFLIGPKILSPMLMTALGKQFSMPVWISFRDYSGLFLLIVVVLFSVIVTSRSVLKLLHQTPAIIIQNRQQIKVTKTTIEQFNLWKKIPFSLQWTIRDIQRNFQRFLLGVFGAIGCMVLLIAAFGVNDSIHYSLDNVFESTYAYKDKINFNQSLNEDQQQLTLESVNGKSQWMEQELINIISNNELVETTALIFSKGEGIHLVNSSKEEVQIDSLQRNEVYISNALAEKNKLKKGDTCYIQTKKVIFPVLIKDLIYLSAPQGIYFYEAVWENNDQRFEPNSLLLQEKEALSKLEKLPHVLTIVSKSTQRNESNQLLNLVLLIIRLLLLAAILLGITIILNANLLIFSERFIEFATLKVLGFTQREILVLSIIEGAILTVIGWLLSFPIGWQFLKFYVRTVSTENQQYLPMISMQSIFLASLILFICSSLVQWIVLRRIKAIEFSTALKSPE